MPSSSGEKLCPICDSPLQPGSKKCGFCGTDLSIFDIDLEPPAKAPEPPAPPPKVSLESRVQEVFSRPVAQERPPPPKVPEPQLVRELVRPAPPPVQVTKVREPEPEARPAPAPTPVPAVPEVPAEEAKEHFECPECGTKIESTASSCPKCGVIFAEEGAEMFQCPACNTLVSVDAKSCPGCGAMFVEPEEGEATATAPEAEPAEVEKVIEEPVEEVRPEKAKLGKLFEVEKPKEEAPAKKGFGKWFRRGKKEPEKEAEEEEPEEEEAVRPEKPPVAKAPPAPPPKAPEPLPVREVRVAKPAPSIPAPAPAAPPAPPAPKDKGRDLARMVAEMKPLLALAREKDVEIGESKQLIDDAAIAGRERQLDKAIELVDKSKRMLMDKIDQHLAQEINRLNEEIRVARDFGGDISRPTTYIQEIARARATGDVEAAYVYADKVKKELQPITGRFNDSRTKLAQLKQLVADCDSFIVDTKEARGMLVDANKAFDARDFDKVDSLIKGATGKLYKAIPARMNDEMRKAKDDLLDAKMKGVNITPMITVLKSATSLMKSGDYAQALREMREFKEMMKKPA